MEPKFSPETIRRYREMEKNKGFERAVREREPVDLTDDELLLECGHKLRMSAKHLDVKFSLAHASRGVHCPDCAREWLKKAKEE
jgi:hypothetical protein